MSGGIERQDRAKPGVRGREDGGGVLAIRQQDEDGSGGQERLDRIFDCAAMLQ